MRRALSGEENLGGERAAVGAATDCGIGGGEEPARVGRVRAEVRPQEEAQRAQDEGFPGEERLYEHDNRRRLDSHHFDSSSHVLSHVHQINFKFEFAETLTAPKFS